MNITDTLSLAANALINERAKSIGGLEYADGPRASSIRIRAERELLADTPCGCASPLAEIRNALAQLDQKR